jgi:hypothetical protein
MAKKFGGFTPQQQQTLLSKVGYTGPAQQDDINKFMMSSPKAASMMGRYAQMAKARVEGGPQTAMQVGGYMAPPTPMQQMQQQAATLDYNRLYAQPNQQPMQQPVAMQEGGTVVGKGGQYFIKDAQGGYSQPYSTALDAYYANKGQTTNPTTGATVQPYTGLNAGAAATTTPNTSGGFDMGAGQQGSTYTTGQEVFQLGYTGVNERAVEYDPSQSLPTAPEFDEAVVDQYTEGFDNWAGGLKDLAKSGNIPEDLTDYRVEGKTVVFKDGTEVPLTLSKFDDEGPRLQQYINKLAEYRDTVQKPAMADYNQQLEQYKQYQAGQAGAGLEDTRAALDTAQRTLSEEQNLLQNYTTQLANMDPEDPQRDVIQGLIDQQQVKVTNARAGLSQAQTNVERVGMPSTTELRATALEAPQEMVQRQDVVTVSDAQREAGMIAEGVGQAPAEAAKAEQTIAKLRADVPLAKEFEAAGMTTAEAAQEVASVMSKLTAVTGKPSAEALAEAATMDPQQLAQLGLTPEQIDRAQRVEAVTPLEVTPEMQVSSAVDFERAKQETNFAAATGVPSTEATVQGQLTQLMSQFEDGETPAWAAGAIRAATQAMASRGLSASSMAGQAIVQAAMESALPIAQMDAQTRASFEAQNLSNRQQAAMFAAEQRAKFLGMEFDQEFQSRVQNAARIADVAQINFTAEQQVALENARMAQTVDIANLDAKNAKILADAAAMSQLDITNLNNRQQANVDRAKAFLQFDMSSMNNQQQVAMFKAQSLASVYMSDTAAENAARQFNASSANQVDMFFSNLQTQIQQFNNEQANAMEKFNAGEANAISQFNAAQQNARDQFNASQSLAVEQANAQWEQAITTMDNAAQNQANRDATIAANGYTETTYNNMLQQERDALDYAWRSADNALQRENSILLTELQTQAEVDKARGEGTGILLNTALEFVGKKILQG